MIALMQLLMAFLVWMNPTNYFEAPYAYLHINEYAFKACVSHNSLSFSVDDPLDEQNLFDCFVWALQDGLQHVDQGEGYVGLMCNNHCQYIASVEQVERAAHARILATWPHLRDILEDTEFVQLESDEFEQTCGFAGACYSSGTKQVFLHIDSNGSHAAIHELAHAIHHAAGWVEPDHDWEKYCDLDGDFGSIGINGVEYDHYACVNHLEYFAELFDWFFSPHGTMLLEDFQVLWIYEVVESLDA